MIPQDRARNSKVGQRLSSVQGKRYHAIARAPITDLAFVQVPIITVVLFCFLIFYIVLLEFRTVR